MSSGVTSVAVCSHLNGSPLLTIAAMTPQNPGGTPNRGHNGCGNQAVLKNEVPNVQFQNQR